MARVKTEKHFDKLYTYAEVKSEAFDDESQIGMLETYSPDIDTVLMIDKLTPKRVWTMVDGDDGMYLIAGYHLVNRIYYVITNEEWADEFEAYRIQKY